jgi:hypothetical protein
VWFGLGERQKEQSTAGLMMTTTNDPWLFNSTEIYNTSPSRIDGITWRQEKELRSLGCRFIHELVSKMRRPGHQAASEAVTESAACIFFHRFFTYESFKKHHRWVMLSLASHPFLWLNLQ